MECLLQRNRFGASPDSRAARFPAFTRDQITGSSKNTLELIGSNVHGGEVQPRRVALRPPAFQIEVELALARSNLLPTYVCLGRVVVELLHLFVDAELLARPER